MIIFALQVVVMTESSTNVTESDVTQEAKDAFISEGKLLSLKVEMFQNLARYIIFVLNIFT